jgi:histidinol-phosphatase (PHP family)
MIKNFVDMHTHTDNSPDGKHNAMYLCECAMTAGLRAIAFTDHCEVDVYKRDHYDRIVRQSYFAILKAINAFEGEILVLRGIELGEAHYDIKTSEEILAAQQYDFVLGAVHNLRGQDDFYFIPTFEGYDLKALMSEYFDEILGLIEWGNFDSLAHLTYPLRYFFERSQKRFDLSVLSDKIDDILSLLAEKDKALEINTKGLRSPINEMCPSFEIVKRFKELGGEKITVGSDAHYGHELGAGIKEAEEVALAAGFKTKFIYQDREPFELIIDHSN